MDQGETRELVDSMFTIVQQLMRGEISKEQVIEQFSDRQFKVLRKNLSEENRRKEGVYVSAP